MGGKRHTGIGFNRPKKRKVSPLVPAPATSEDTVETKEPSPPPSPEREPSPVAPARPAPKPRHLTIDKSGLALAREQMRDAEKEYQKVQRRWERKKLTYFDYDKYSPWAEVSVVQRIKARLQQADDDLDAARSDWVFRREVWLRLRTHLRMTKLKEENPGDKEIVSQWLTAGIRLTGIWPPELWRPHVEELGPGHFAARRSVAAADLVARELGLARAWGLTHSDELAETSAPAETEWQRIQRNQARAKEQTEAHARKCILRRLEAEKADPSLRVQGGCMGDFGGGVGRAILREMGVCVCSPCPRPDGACPKCCGEAGETSGSAL
jgi:hypothetical protein